MRLGFAQFLLARSDIRDWRIAAREYGKKAAASYLVLKEIQDLGQVRECVLALVRRNIASEQPSQPYEKQRARIMYHRV
jgi:hypothetical protein